MALKPIMCRDRAIISSCLQQKMSPKREKKSTKTNTYKHAWYLRRAVTCIHNVGRGLQVKRPTQAAMTQIVPGISSDPSTDFVHGPLCPLACCVCTKRSNQRAVRHGVNSWRLGCGPSLVIWLMSFYGNGSILGNCHP